MFIGASYSYIDLYNSSYFWIDSEKFHGKNSRGNRERGLNIEIKIKIIFAILKREWNLLF